MYAQVTHVEDYIHIVQIPKKDISKIDFAICAQPKETIGAFYDRQTVKPDYVFNAGFFIMKSGDTLYNVIDEFAGKSWADSYKVGMGTTNGVDLQYGNKDNIKYKDFVSGYPCLVENGAVLPITYAKEINYRAARTALGYNDDCIFVVCIDKKPGMSLTELGNYMKNIGCRYAINLDGGGSSRLHGPDNKPINNPSENRAVDSVFAIYLKKIEENDAVMDLARAGIISDTNYWNEVMAGKREVSIQNLEALMKKTATVLQSAQKDGLYRVQVGAFSKKAGAESKLNELKEKGFNGYIK